MSGLDQEHLYLPDDSFDLPRYASHGRPLPPSPYTNQQALASVNPDARYMSPQQHPPLPPPPQQQQQQQHHHHQHQQQLGGDGIVPKQSRLSQLTDAPLTLSRSSSMMAARTRSRDNRSQMGDNYMMVDDVERAYSAAGQSQHQQQPQQQQQPPPQVMANAFYPGAVSAMSFGEMYASADGGSSAAPPSSGNLSYSSSGGGGGLSATPSTHRRSHTLMSSASKPPAGLPRLAPPPASPARAHSHNVIPLSASPSSATMDPASLLPYAYQQHQQQQQPAPSGYGVPGAYDSYSSPGAQAQQPPPPPTSELKSSVSSSHLYALQNPSYEPDVSSATAPLSRAYTTGGQYGPSGAVSVPASPMSYSSGRTHHHHHQQQQQQQQQPHLQSDYFSRGRSMQGTPMQTDPSPAPPSQPMQTPREREDRRGFVRVRDIRDLKPMVNQHPMGRRQDPVNNGLYLSPLKSLTSHLSQTYNICNPAFSYETAHNPRRVLTKPSKAMHNEGYDNEDNDYILYVNDYLGGEESAKYLILDILGQGTFGQVVKCQNVKNHEIVAVKVVKNKPAYFNQSMMEVTILELLNRHWDVSDEHHILRLRDTFIHKKHLCLVFELLSSNLYELIKQNQFGGLSTQLVKVFTAQLLDALSVLKEAHIIHCDLKPENILLKSLQSPQIKVIDFGSACHERQTVYTYIQSRFYRSPEVLLGLQYTSAIDMWSLGCIVVELFLGLPLFPGTSEYNQVCRIVEMLGMPPSYMLEMGKSSGEFFSHSLDEYGRKKWRLKTIDQYCRDKKTTEQPGKKYFSATTLPEIIKHAPNTNKTNKAVDMEKEANLRLALIDFCQGLLNLNPVERWSPQQAMGHPFITGEKFSKPYVPADVATARANAKSQMNLPAPPSSGSSSSSSSKRPYGGLVPTQPQGTRAYQDAATYNQHLNQHQVYTAQAASAAAAQNAFRNPYAAPTTQAVRDDATGDYASQQRQAQAAQVHAQAQQAQTQAQQYAASVQSRGNSQVQPPLPAGPAYMPVSATTGSLNPISNNPPASTYYGNRTRANTINQMDAGVPPQLAKIANLGVPDGGVGRNLTPVLNREDAIREWERRQSGGKRQTNQTQYPHLDYLQEQAELAGSSLSQWNNIGHSARYPRQSGSSTTTYHAAQTPQTSYSGTTAYNTPSAYQQSQSGYNDSQDGANYRVAPTVQITSPPQAYSGSQSEPARYAASYQAPSSVPYDSYDMRDGMGTLYAPIQPQPYQNPPASHSGHQMSPRQPQSANALSNSFYGSSIVPSGVTPSTPQRQYSNAASPTLPQSAHSHSSSKDGNRRMSGIDSWQR